MKKEFNYNYFNGVISKVKLMVGNGGYIRYTSKLTELIQSQILSD